MLTHPLRTRFALENRRTKLDVGSIYCFNFIDKHSVGVSLNLVKDIYRYYSFYVGGVIGGSDLQ